jgi:MFS family permease
MRRLVAVIWPLLLGIGFIMTGNGLQQSLLGLRAEAEGFSRTLTGSVMTAYYVGMLAGTLLVPRIVGRVGHIRVFAALTALAATAILAAPIFVNGPAWAVMRGVTGFCYAGMYIVAESWLNDRVGNELRGRLWSIYMFMQFGGLIIGQALLNLAPPTGFELFSLAAALLSLAVVPILVSARPAPLFEASAHMHLLQVYRLSPLAIAGGIAIGAAHGAFWQMGAVYGSAAGLTVAEISLFISSAVCGALLFQWPVGRLSDRVDRRRVILGVCAGSALAALAVLASGHLSTPLLFVAVALFGGLSLPMYSLLGALLNDRLRAEQMVAASSALVLAYGIGAVSGPPVAGALMDHLGADGLFVYLAVMHAGLALFALHRMLRRPAPPAPA